MLHHIIDTMGMMTLQVQLFHSYFQLFTLELHLAAMWEYHLLENLDIEKLVS